MLCPRKTYLTALLLVCYALQLSHTGPIQAQERAPQQGQTAEKAQPPKAQEADYAQEAFVVEQLKTLFRFEQDGTGQREVSLRAKVQSTAGVENLGQLIFPYSSSNEKLEIDYVRVRKTGGGIISASASNVQDLTAPITREAPVYTDLRQQHVTVPGLRPGDVLEYHVVWRLHTPLALNHFWLEHDFLKNNFIVLDERLEVNIPRDSTVKLKTEPGLAPTVKEQAGRRIYSWQHANLKREDKDELAQKKRAADEPKPPQIQMTTFQSWAEVGQWYAGLERERIMPDGAIRARVAEQLRGRTSEQEKVEALYEYVAKNFRYVSLSFGQGRYQPHAAAEVFANQYGDCKDKHTLLAAMLRAAGLRAYPALIPSARKLDTDVPSPAQFDHVISAIPLGRETLWVDTTTEVAPFRLLAPTLRNKQALLVPDDAPARLETTPADPPFPATELLEVEGQVSELGTLAGHSRLTARGDTELFLRLMFRHTPKNDWKEIGQILATSAGLFVEVGEVRPSDPAATDKPFQVEYDFTNADFLDWSSKKAKVDLPLPALDLPAADADKQEDSPPLRLGSPTEITYRLKLSLPTKYQARLPLPVAMTRDYAEYRSTYKLEGNTLVAERTFRLRQRELPAARTQDYLAFVASARADAEQTLSVETNMAGAPTIPDSTKVEELVQAADAAEKNENYELAEELLKRVLAKEPKHKSARRQLGWALYSQRKYDAAIQVLRQQTESNPFDDYAYNLIGQALWRQQKYAEAEAAFRKQLEVTPLHKWAQANLGRLLIEWRRYKEAVPELEKALSLDPDDEFLYVNMGRAYLNLGQTEQAIEAFDKAVKLAPGPPIWNDVAYFLSLSKVRLEKARQYAESAVAARMTELRNVELERLTSDDLENFSNLIAYWDTLGWVHFQQGNIDLAERYITAAWLLGQYSEGGDHLGQIYEKRGRTEEAIRTYALAAVAYQPVPEPRERLVRLVGQDKLDALLSKARAELVALRTIKLGTLLKDEKEKTEADFYLALVPGPAQNAQVAEVKFIRGSEKLRPLAAALKAAGYRLSLPEDAPVKLIRRGTLTCQPPKGECMFVMLHPEEVPAPD